jgi:3-dehydroquinate dehydratase / shikimate dehydrogenase
MQALLIATLTAVPTAADLAELSTSADWLEIRADLDVAPDPAVVRERFRGKTLFTLRSRGEGGRSQAWTSERRDALRHAAEHWDFVDLEAERDLERPILAAIPPERRIISWHGPGEDLDELRDRFSRMETVPARYYKLIPTARTAKDALLPLALLRSLGRNDVISFAGGQGATWTRLLAPRLGAPIVYGGWGGRRAAPGQPSLDELRSVFGLPDLPPVTDLFGIVGNPVLRSLSPRLHNGLYREQGVEALYLPFQVESFGDFWLDLVESGSLGVLGFRLAGLSITAPFKEVALAVAGASSPLAERVGAVNTLIRHSGVWEGETTDPAGVVEPLAERGIAIEGRRAAVVGAGGAGRAAAWGLAHSGGEVTLFNRGVERGARVARELGLAFEPLAELDAGEFDILVNATPIGQSSVDEPHFAASRLRPGATVIDLVYRADGPTRQIEEARGAGCTAIDGREALLHQAVPQYRLMTGRELPLALGRELLGLEAAG